MFNVGDSRGRYVRSRVDRLVPCRCPPIMNPRQIFFLLILHLFAARKSYPPRSGMQNPCIARVRVSASNYHPSAHLSFFRPSIHPTAFDIAIFIMNSLSMSREAPATGHGRDAGFSSLAPNSVDTLIVERRALVEVTSLIGG